MSDVLIKVIDSRLCGHVQPVRRDMSGIQVDEHVCVLLKGHDSEHSDGKGRVWRDLDWLRRKLENAQPSGLIVSLPPMKEK